MFWKFSNYTRLKVRVILRTFKTLLVPLNIIELEVVWFPILIIIIIFVIIVPVIIIIQGSTIVPSSRPGQVDFEVGQVTFQGHLPDGQVLGQTLHQITIIFKSVK